MAHAIDQTTGRAAMFSGSNVTPWHRLGTVVSGTLSSVEALREAVLDWTVSLRPVQTVLADGTVAAVRGKWATVRDDTSAPLGIVGDRYRVYNNRDAFDFMDSIHADGIARWETAGALDGGKRVWMLCRLPEVVQVSPGDEVLTYGLITTSHDGSSPITVTPTSVRVVCANTLRLALAGAGARKMTIRHTESARGRIQDARRAFGVVSERVAEFRHEADALRSVSMTETEMRQYVAPFFPTRPARAVKSEAPPAYSEADMLELVLAQTVGADIAGDVAREMAQEIQAEAQELSDRTYAKNERILAEILGTFEQEGAEFGYNAWTGYNAVSNYLDHGATFRGAGREREENRFISVVSGNADVTKQEAYSAALALTR